MRIGQVKEYLRFKVQQSNPDSVIMIGPGGIGKTQIVYQVGEETNLPVKVINLQHVYPEQLMGVPKDDGTGYVRWLRPRDLPEERCILFLDEITNASALKQNAAMQLLMEKRVGDHRLHPDTLIVAAGNRPQDNILAKVLPSLVVNRCTFIQVDPPGVDEWLADFAIPNGIHPLIRAFVKSRPQFLFEESDATSEQQFARPRCWERLSRVLNELLKMEPTVRDELIIADWVRVRVRRLRGLSMPSLMCPPSMNLSRARYPKQLMDYAFWWRTSSPSLNRWRTSRAKRRRRGSRS